MDAMDKRADRKRDYDMEQKEMKDANKVSDIAKTAVDAVEKELKYE